jgi:tRNA U34 5-carboxymethylaminomethyl modifying GTPase MnmE/TrmE
MVAGMVSSIEQLQILRQAGIEQAQAEAILLVVEQKHENLATKEDIKELRIATKEDINQLRIATKEDINQLRIATKEDINQLRIATKEDINQLRIATLNTFSTQVQLAEVKVDLIKWMVGMAISTVGLGLAGVYFLLSHFKP